MTGIDKVLKRKEELFESLLQYSQQLAGLSFLRDAAAYSGLVELKEQCIEELVKNETVLNRFLASGTAPEQAEASVLIESWNQRMAPAAREIKALDRQCRSQFQTEMQSVRNRLNSINRGKKGIAGYKAVGRVIGAAGAYTDKRS